MTPENYQAAMNAPIQRNSDGSDPNDSGVEMFTKPWEWIGDMFFAGIELLGWISLIALVCFAAGYGLMKAGLV